jgi:hypothetical protein
MPKGGLPPLFAAPARRGVLQPVVGEGLSLSSSSTPKLGHIFSCSPQGTPVNWQSAHAPKKQIGHSQK